MSTTPEDTTQARGVRATVEVGADGCPVAEATEDGGRVTDVRKTCGGETAVVEEFDAEGVDALAPKYRRMFEADGHSVYRVTRPCHMGCACDVVESRGTVVSSVSAEDGVLRLSFHADSVDEVKLITSALQSEYDVVSLVELSGRPLRPSDRVVFDASDLTGRQREAIEKALDMGYFERPREATATDVAEELGITPSTLGQHLAAAESKILESVLG